MVRGSPGQCPQSALRWARLPALSLRVFPSGAGSLSTFPSSSSHQPLSKQQRSWCPLQCSASSWLTGIFSGHFVWVPAPSWLRLRRGLAVLQFSSVAQSCPTLWPHELQHARPPCPSPALGVCSNSCPLSQWCHPTISSSFVPFSSCLQSFPVSGSFPVSWLSASGGQRIGVSATMSVLLMNILGWFPFGWPGLSLFTLYLACAPTGSVPWIPCTFCSQNAEKSGFLWLGNGSSQFLLHFSIRTFETVFILWPNYLFSTIYKDTMYKTYSIVTIWIQMHLSS